MVRQPKHVVLTARNQHTLSREWITRLKKALTSLRRSKFARNWKAGVWNLEVTNEGRGWHVHFHLLIEATWIESPKLAIEWGKRVGQEFAIVKVLDAREKNYLKECTKYTVKGTDLAGWSGQDIATFIKVFSNQNCHGTFGELYKASLAFRRMLKELNQEKKACECGCVKFVILSEHEWILEGSTTIPPPDDQQPSPTPPQQLESAFLNSPIYWH